MDALEARDIRDLLRLLGELREMGADPAAWRAHLALSLERACGACISSVVELRVRRNPQPVTPTCGNVVTPLQTLDYGLDPAVRDRFYSEVYFTDHTADDALDSILPLYGSRFTVTRGDLVDDRRWDRSLLANERYRAHGCDDFVFSMAPVTKLGVISAIGIYRSPGRRFGPRERLWIELLHEELDRDWQRAVHGAGPRLTARQRQVLDQLTQGASEKELAYELGVSAHTVHDHVKAIYRAFGARSRGELLAQVAKQTQAPHTRLFADALD